MATRPDPFTLAREIEAKCINLAAQSAARIVSFDSMARELDNLAHAVRALRRSMVRNTTHSEVHTRD